MIESIIEHIINAFEIFLSGYAIIYIVWYLTLAILSYLAIFQHLRYKKYLEEETLFKSNYLMGVSVIAPAFNEGLTIIENVHSLLSLTYPKFEVIIINDGSTDDTMEKLIAEFDLIKVNFYYREHILTAPVRGHYKSTNPVYSKLLVVDKVNRKSKADASNVGINSAKFPLFLCTDVDCILKQDTILKLAKPFMENTTKVIATGAGIRISNSCEIKNGFLTKIHYPKEWLPRFQELEYIRAFLFGRMGWSKINGLLLVSGGLGMFDKEVVINAGGYSYNSLGEDMELITRMRKYMYDQNQKFLIQYIPESLCWTEVPATKAIFLRQRTRWARGLIDTLMRHRKMFLNPHYERTGLLILPYYFIFEFLVPIIEAIGLTSIIISIFMGFSNVEFLVWSTFSIYLFYLAITLISVFIDEVLYKNYTSGRDLITVILMAAIEPIVYHPICVYTTLKGYWYYFSSKEHSWGEMTRKGFENATKK